MRERESWIDSWKGILIFLVVLGHVAGMMCHFSAGDARGMMRYLYRFIYLFHMTAFFLLVGVLSGLKLKVQGLRSGAPQIRSFAWRKFQRLLVPYFFWGVVSVVIFWATAAVTARMGGSATDGYYGARMFDFPWWRPFISLLHAGFWPNGEGFRCNSVLWFLPCMFGVLVARNAIQRFTPQTLNASKTQALFLAILCLILGGVLRLYVGPLPWCLDRVPRFLAFVYLGELVASLPTPKRPNVGTSKLLPLGWLVFALGVIYFPDLAAAYSSWTWYFAEAGMALFGGVLSMGLAKVVDCRLLAGLGVASLGIMLIHKFPILAVQGIVGRIGGLEAWQAGCLALGLAVTVTVLSWGAAKLIRKWTPWSVGGNV